MNDQTRINALAKYLKVDPSTIEPRGDMFTTTINGRKQEYYVITHDEAKSIFTQSIESLIDDAGWCFGSEFSIRDYMDPDEFFDDMDSHSEDYASDIEFETKGHEPYANRFVEECVDRDIISDDDLVENENGLLDFESKDDHDNAFNDFVESYNNDFEDSVEYMLDTYGVSGMQEFMDVKEHIDIQALVDDIVSSYGYEHELAGYDGTEIDLGNGLYAYRWN